MKIVTRALLLVGALAAPQGAMAASKTTVGVGTGAVAGALVGGPVGAVVGGIVGGYIGATSESPRPRRRRVRATRRAAVVAPRRLHVAQEPALPARAVEAAKPAPAATGSLAPVTAVKAAPAKPATTWQNPR
jgi:hypothetical protein